jgi:hypothetical protein
VNHQGGLVRRGACERSGSRQRLRVSRDGASSTLLTSALLMGTILRIRMKASAQGQIPGFRQIHSPDELRAVAREIHAAVEAGLLEHVGAPSACEAGLERISSGIWPDVIQMAFCSPSTGGRYLLTCETYHGAGGDWGPESES